MTFRRSLLACTAGSILLTAPLLGQNSPAPAVAPSVATPTAADDKDAVDPRHKIIPEVKFENVPFEDVVEFLQDVSKDYRAVVVRKARNEEGPLVTMRLKNVSVQQVIEVVVAAHGGIDISQVDGPGGAVDVIIIHPRAMVDGADAGGGFGGGLGGPPGPAEPERAVRVYRLAGIVQMMMDRPAPAGTANSEKESLDKVLSLIKATLELTGGREAPTIQVHAETLTLIFKGSPQQHAALGDVLSALESNAAVRKTGDEADAGRLKRQLAETQARLELAMQEAAQVKAELNAIQRRSDNEIQDLTNMRRAYQAELEDLRQKVAEMERAAAKPK